MTDIIINDPAGNLRRSLDSKDETTVGDLLDMLGGGVLEKDGVLKANRKYVLVAGTYTLCPAQQRQQNGIDSSVWRALVPWIIDLCIPQLEIYERQEEPSSKRTIVEIDAEDTGTEDSVSAGKKRRKFWKASCTPATVPSCDEADWYLGGLNSELFIRQCGLDCINIIWEAAEESKKQWDADMRLRCVAFIVTGPPGLGKSWSSNTFVWSLLKNRQNMWFHSASGHTLTTIEFNDGDKNPRISELAEEQVTHNHPPTGTWFLYDSVGGAEKSTTMIPFREQPPGVPCVIFSSPKDTNYKAGIKNMEGGPGGGKVWYLWMPSWEWHELEAVMRCLYKEAEGGKNTNFEEFKDVTHAFYLLWGGFPRRFNSFYQAYRDGGKDAALKKSRESFNEEMSLLASNLVRTGPFIRHNDLDRLSHSGQSSSLSTEVAPPSWLLFPFPIDSVKEPFRNKVYRFCSQEAELAFWSKLEVEDVSVVRQFCLDIFKVPGPSGIAFEHFANFVLTRTELNKFRWKKYESKSKPEQLQLPKCLQQKCDMKTDLGNFQAAIQKCVESDQTVVIDPESDQQDAIDMFVVCKLGGHWHVLAMQDTISKTHSFHPLKILEYRAAAQEALEQALGAKIQLCDDFFRHVVVVPTENAQSPFRLQAATMPKLASVEAVQAKFNTIKVQYSFDGWNVSMAKKACQSANIKGRSGLSGGGLLTAGAEVLLLEAAEKEAKGLTWVLDGLLNE